MRVDNERAVYKVRYAVPNMRRAVYKARVALALQPPK